MGSRGGRSGSGRGAPRPSAPSAAEPVGACRGLGCLQTPNRNQHPRPPVMCFAQRAGGGYLDGHTLPSGSGDAPATLDLKALVGPRAPQTLRCWDGDDSDTHWSTHILPRPRPGLTEASVSPLATRCPRPARDGPAALTWRRGEEGEGVHQAQGPRTRPLPRCLTAAGSRPHQPPVRHTARSSRSESAPRGTVSLELQQTNLLHLRLQFCSNVSSASRRTGGSSDLLRDQREAKIRSDRLEMNTVTRR